VSTDRRPPRLARWLLRLQPLGGHRAEIEADLLELFQTRAAERGPGHASRRYYLDVLSLWRRPRAPRSSEPRIAPGSRIGRFSSDLHADLRYAARVMRRQPAFVAVAILSLAFGVGANTLVFSVINALVLKPLPVQRPQELVFVQPSAGWTVSFPTYRDVRDRATTLAGVVAYRIAPMSLDRDTSAARVWGYLVSGNYFDVLGVQPAAGRFFHQAEDQPPTPSPLAVLSYECWQGRFAGDPAIVGGTIHLNGGAYQVIGIAPRGFVGTELFYRPEVWVPMTMQPQIEARTSYLDERMTRNTMALARVKTGVSRAAAEANVQAIATALAREYPKSDDGLSLRLSEPGLVGDAIRTPVKAFTIGVLTLAGLTLLMACVNLAVVLTASGADRRRELAIRLSIGAGAGRLRRQVLTETLLLGVAGGLAGLAIAYGAARALSAWRLPVELPVQFEITPDVRVFAFALALSIAAGLLFGLAPARQAARTDPNLALKGHEAPGFMRRRVAFRDVLVAVQVALCVLLLAACLLALRGLQTALTKPIGLEPRGVTIAGFDVGLAGYEHVRGRDFEQRALEAVRQLPGVDAAAYSDTLPLNIDQSSSHIVPDDRPNLALTERIVASRYRVSSDFFRTLGTRVLQGREIRADDTQTTPAVAVVNETFARQVFRTTNGAIGRRFRYGTTGSWLEVVGLVEDGKYLTLNEAPRAAVFEAIDQHYSSTIVLSARSSLPSSDVAAAIRAALARLDPRLPLYETQSLEAMLGLVLFPSRVASVALGAFGVLALLLALTGLYGVVTNAVARRRREIGIRIAIGARPSQVVRLLVWRTLALLGVGAMAGGLLTVLAGRVLESIVYDASPRDPWVLAGVGITLVVVGMLSCWAPVRRALGVKPSLALRNE
jgi:predicted permease